MELKKSAVDCGWERVSDGFEDEDGTRTWSAAVTAISQWSTSFRRAVTSSTEHSFEASRATLNSSTRPSRARASPSSGNAGAEGLTGRFGREGAAPTGGISAVVISVVAAVANGWESLFGVAKGPSKGGEGGAPWMGLEFELGSVARLYIEERGENKDSFSLS